MPSRPGTHPGGDGGDGVGDGGANSGDDRLNNSSKADMMNSRSLERITGGLWVDR